MPFFGLSWITTAAFTLPVAYYFVRYLVTPRPLPGIPHHPLRPLVGDIPKVVVHTKGPGTGYNAWFIKQHIELASPVVQTFMGPRFKVVSVLDAQEVEDILTRRTDEIGHTRSWFIDSIPLAQITMETGPMWKRHRKLLSPSMSGKYLAQMTPRIGKSIENLIKLWNRKLDLLPDRQGVFDAEQDIGLATMDGIADITFGETFGGLESAHASVQSSKATPLDEKGAIQFPPVSVSLELAIRDLFWAASVYSWCPSATLASFIIKCLPSWRRSMKQLSRLLNAKINEARSKADEIRAMKEDLEQADCVIDMAIQREGMDGQEHMDDRELKDELLQFILAGQDTTAAALEWGVKFLASNPDVQRRLRTELMAAFDTAEPRPITYKDVNGGATHYLEAVVAEVLRCAAVGGGVPREAHRDTTILGHFIPRGTFIVLLLHHSALLDNEEQKENTTRLDHSRSPTSRATIRSKGLWKDDGVRFNPDRWLDADGKFNQKAGSSFPFSAGPRACFGQRMAVLTLKLYIAHFNMAFFFDSVPDHLNDWRVKETPINHPMHCFIRPRSWSELEG